MLASSLESPFTRLMKGESTDLGCPGQGSCDCSWIAGGANCGEDDGSECFCNCCCNYKGGQCKWNPGGGGGQASTTRYWDCNQPFCEPGNLPYPHTYRMFKMSDGRFFGHAAASDKILQGKAACEHCYETSYGGRRVVLKVDNWCPCDSNPPGCCEPHFDIAVPGTDYASASVSNVCQQSDSSIDYSKGRQQCSHWPWEDSSNCCFQVSSDAQLNAACLIMTQDLVWDNPRVNFNEVACPYEEFPAYDAFWEKEYPSKFGNATETPRNILDLQYDFIKNYMKAKKTRKEKN